MPTKVQVARLVRANEAGFPKTLDRYRRRVDEEIAKASEHGARWWSRLLVDLCKEVGLVRLDK